MMVTRRSVGLLLLGAGAFLAARPLFVRLGAQEQAPNRPEFTLTASDGRFSPDRLEVRTGDLVKLTLESKDIGHSFAIDEYRIVRRIPAGASTTFEFRADRAGTFRFYCNLSDGNHGPMEGQLVVRP
jgi:nitrosocyanin